MIERHIISFKLRSVSAARSQVGEVVKLNTDHDTGRFAISAMDAAPMDERHLSRFNRNGTEAVVRKTI